jgi:hypothetical protein
MRHMAEQYVDDAGRVMMDIGEFRRSDFRFISDETRLFFESLAEEVLSVLSVSLVKTELDASRYMMLPLDLREFLESRPTEMFNLHRKMNEAVVSRKGMSDIQSLLDECSDDMTGRGAVAFFIGVRKIVEEYNLHANENRVNSVRT